MTKIYKRQLSQSSNSIVNGSRRLKVGDSIGLDDNHFLLNHQQLVMSSREAREFKKIYKVLLKGCDGHENELLAGSRERTGILPFMSICTLLQSDRPRTVLDDCEAVIYNSIWLAMFGATIEDRESIVVPEDAPIYKWRNGSIDQIANTKMYNMDTISNFFNLISEGYHFKQEYISLVELVIELRAVLFENTQMEPDCHGIMCKCKSTETAVAQIMMSGDGIYASNKQNDIAPQFSKRVRNCDIIIDNSFTVLRKAKEATGKKKLVKRNTRKRIPVAKTVENETTDSNGFGRTTVVLYRRTLVGF